MISARRRTTARRAASAVVTGLLATGAIATATAAVADENPPQHNEGATATLDGLTTFGKVNVTHNGETDEYSAGLFTLKDDNGGTYLTYCVDLFTETAAHAPYKEVDWDSSKLHDNENAGKILWVLQHSYPVLSADELVAQAGVEGELSEDEAAAATQAAIWRLSDDVETEPKNDVAAEVADWLTENAQTTEEPAASLSLSPSQVNGESGGLVGPVTVDTTAASAAVSLDEAAAAQGVTLTDAQGTPLDEGAVAAGTDVYFSVPEGTEDGTATLTASVESAVSIGRVFTGAEAETQTMILAGTENTRTEATAGAAWTTPEAPAAPAPDVTFEEKCSENGGGVDVTITNNGDAPGTYTIGDQTVTVQPGTSSEAVRVPAEEDTQVTVEVKDETGTVIATHTATIDCAPAQTETPAAPPADEQPEDEGPAPAGDSEDLAETGSGTNPALFGGIALALLVVGGGVVFFIRRRGAGTN
ncbi:thioester domain-containing protein [Streptomyces sp. RFCAC02]|uniref:thioester domain-containing protein n=1 Tax=Streptomyces sp. RFCAC02 TaxID=2499143 RepID=UPI001020DE77|nr:thioester domain-containing protein [Streptomyces sp. RFCAC02]